MEETKMHWGDIIEQIFEKRDRLNKNGREILLNIGERYWIKNVLYGPDKEGFPPSEKEKNVLRSMYKRTNEKECPK